MENKDKEMNKFEDRMNSEAQTMKVVKRTNDKVEKSELITIIGGEQVSKAYIQELYEKNCKNNS